MGKPKHKIGDIVYLITDTEQKDHIVVGILIRPTGIEYELCIGSNRHWHYDIEISIEKDVLKSVTN